MKGIRVRVASLVPLAELSAIRACFLFLNISFILVGIRILGNTLKYVSIVFYNSFLILVVI